MFCWNRILRTFLLMSLCFSGHILFAEDTTHAIRGTLYDYDNFDPIVNVEVLINGSAYKTVTDSEGRYELDNLPDGVYDIIFLAPSYQKKTLSNIDVSQVGDLTLNTALEKNHDSKPTEVTVKLDVNYFKKIEYPLKSSFVYKLASYITWKEVPKKEFLIGVVGKLPENSKLEIPQGKTIGGLPVRVIPITTLTEANSCKVLFFANTEPAFAEQILNGISGLEILTIGDTECVKKKNLAINLSALETTLSYDVNQPILSQCHLTISDELFNKAHKVYKK